MIVKIIVRDYVGREVNPYPELISPSFALYGSKGNPEWADFENTVQKLPCPSLQSSDGKVVEAEVVDQSQGIIAGKLGDWLDTDSLEYDRDFLKLPTRQIYRPIEADKIEQGEKITIAKFIELNDHQPFEEWPALAEAIQYAACYWKTDGTSWTNLLEQINKVCLEAHFGTKYLSQK